MFRSGKAAILSIAMSAGVLVGSASATVVPPPTNDTAAGATEVTLGFTEVLDTTAMTKDDEEQGLASLCDAWVEGGVWYTLIGTGAPVEVITDASSYRSYIFAESLHGDERTVEQCEWPRFDTEPGVRYRVLVADEDTTDGIGGELHIAFNQGAPDPTAKLTLSGRGIVQRNGAARVHGAYRCTDAINGFLFVAIQQGRGSSMIGPAENQELKALECDGRRHRWSMAAGHVYNPETDLLERVRFHRGRAHVSASLGSVCAILTCGEGAGAEHYVRLRTRH